jgi:predicted transcriptional regulator
MKTTSMQLDSDLRDQLARIAEHDYQGVPLGEAVRRLVKEHRIGRIIRQYETLRADPEQWAGYRAEAHLTDNAAGDGLPDRAR